MPVETATYISSFVLTNPDGDADTVADLDDSDRSIKTAVKQSFPNINAAVNASPGDLNATLNFEETISATTQQVTIATGKNLKIDAGKFMVGSTTMIASGADLNATENFEETISATTQQVTITTGKLFKADEGKYMVGSTTMTASGAELNIMDGATFTTAEANLLDESAEAVTNYGSGVRTHIFDDSPNSTTFDVATNIATSFESVGPTGSSATNIWTAMDAIPSGATAVIIGVKISYTATSGGSCRLKARVTGSAVAAADQQDIAIGTGDAADDVVTEATIGLDGSRRFDLHYTASGTDLVDTCIIFLKGFIK